MLNKPALKMVILLVLVGLGMTPVFAQNCRSNPAVSMLYSSILGAFPVAPSQVAPLPGWISYMHPAFPDINFVHPASWPARTLQSAQSVGVRFSARDGSGVWESHHQTVFGQQITPSQVAQYAARNLLGSGGRVICSASLGASGPVQGYFWAVSDGSRIAVAEGLVSYDPTSGMPILASYHAMISPAPQFAKVAREVYLRLIMQLFRSGGGDPDSDGDGVNDSKDKHPNDPSKS